MNTKRVIRLNLLMLGFILGPLLIINKFMIDGLFYSLTPTVIDNLCETITCDYKGCIQVDKNLKYICEYKKEIIINTEINDRFEASQALVTGIMTNNLVSLKKMSIVFYLVMTMILLVSVVVVFLWWWFWTIRYNGHRVWGAYVKTKSGVGNDLVRLRSFGLDIDVSNIQKIKIITTTPLIPTRVSIDQINWRDIVVIFYHDNGNLSTERINLFNYPGFKKVVIDILRNNPQIQLEFTKRPIWSAENLGYN